MNNKLAVLILDRDKKEHIFNTLSDERRLLRLDFEVADIQKNASRMETINDELTKSFPAWKQAMRDWITASNLVVLEKQALGLLE